MQKEMSLAKSPNKVCFYKDLRVVSLIVWGRCQNPSNILVQPAPSEKEDSHKSSFRNKSKKEALQNWDFRKLSFQIDFSCFFGLWVPLATNGVMLWVVVTKLVVMPGVQQSACELGILLIVVVVCMIRLRWPLYQMVAVRKSVTSLRFELWFSRL